MNATRVRARWGALGRSETATALRFDAENMSSSFFLLEVSG